MVPLLVLFWDCIFMSTSPCVFHTRVLWILPCSFNSGPKYICQLVLLIIFKLNFSNLFGFGQTPQFLSGGAKPPRPPLNGRPQHLIEAAKRGRLDQMLFFRRR